MPTPKAEAELTVNSAAVADGVPVNDKEVVAVDAALSVKVVELLTVEIVVLLGIPKPTTEMPDLSPVVSTVMDVLPEVTTALRVRLPNRNLQDSIRLPHASKAKVPTT
jgi:hypothetical protein